MLEKRYEKFDNFIFDLDGTVWKWTELIEKAINVFAVLKRLEKNVFFITNNTLLTREGFVKKLQNFGINAKYENILNPSIVAINVLKGKRVFCLGEGIISELRKNKIMVSESKANAVLVSTDRTLTYDKLAKACDFVNKGADFYKTADGGVLVYGNKRLPGSGAIAKAVEKCCNREAEVIGKPSKYMINIVKNLKLEPEKTILFGDECNSDIVLGNKLGFKTVLVLTGRDREKDYLKVKGECEPKIVLKSITNILK